MQIQPIAVDAGDPTFSVADLFSEAVARQKIDSFQEHQPYSRLANKPPRFRDCFHTVKTIAFDNAPIVVRQNPPSSLRIKKFVLNAISLVFSCLEPVVSHFGPAEAEADHRGRSFRDRKWLASPPSPLHMSDRRRDL
jgi:hypothetical protein